QPPSPPATAPARRPATRRSAAAGDRFGLSVGSVARPRAGHSFPRDPHSKCQSGYAEVERMTTASITSHPHEVNRLAVAVGLEFAQFRDLYEENVPPLDCDRLAAFVREEADWDTILRATPDNAPHGIIRYWTVKIRPLMHLARDS